MSSLNKRFANEFSTFLENDLRNELCGTKFVINIASVCPVVFFNCSPKVLWDRDVFALKRILFSVKGFNSKSHKVCSCVKSPILSCEK